MRQTLKWTLRIIELWRMGNTAHLAMMKMTFTWLWPRGSMQTISPFSPKQIIDVSVVTLLWPWPWLNPWPWPTYSEVVHVYQNEVSSSRFSKVRAETGQTDSQTHTHADRRAWKYTPHLRMAIIILSFFAHSFSRSPVKFCLFVSSSRF